MTTVRTDALTREERDEALAEIAQASAKVARLRYATDWNDAMRAKRLYEIEMDELHIRRLLDMLAKDAEHEEPR